jgi:hypothetical protein
VDKVLVWATDAQTGLPLANASITCVTKLQSLQSGTTDQDGLVTLGIRV